MAYLRTKFGVCISCYLPCCSTPRSLGSRRFQALGPTWQGGGGRACSPPAEQPGDGRGKSAWHQSSKGNTGGLLGCHSPLSQGFAPTHFLPGPNPGTTSFPPFFQIHSCSNVAKGGNLEKESWACRLSVCLWKPLLEQELGPTNVAPLE